MVEQGSDWEVLAVFPGLEMGQYLLEVKGSMPVPSLTCTGGLCSPTPSMAVPEGQLTEAGLGAER